MTRKQTIPDKIYKYLFIGPYMFVLKYLWNKHTKGYTDLGLYDQYGITINVYYLDVYQKRNGNILEKIELDKDIDRNIRNYLKKQHIKY